MYIASFGHEHLELKLRSTDVYFDIRDEFPQCNAKSKFGINKRIQRNYLKQNGVKQKYREQIYTKVVKKITTRKHHNFRVFIGDKHGAKEAVILVEKLEKDLLKKQNILANIDHITLTAIIDI